MYQALSAISPLYIVSPKYTLLMPADKQRRTSFHRKGVMGASEKPADKQRRTNFQRKGVMGASEKPPDKQRRTSFHRKGP
jgi:hypothetical protein